MQATPIIDAESKARRDFLNTAFFLIVFFALFAGLSHVMLLGVIILSPVFGTQFVATGYKHASAGAKIWSRVFIWLGYIFAFLAPIAMLAYFSDASIPLPFQRV